MRVWPEGVNRRMAAQTPISIQPCIGAVVLVEALLGNSIERQRGDRAVEVRRHHAPFADGATPTGEVVAVNPNQTSLHALAFVDFRERTR